MKRLLILVIVVAFTATCLPAAYARDMNAENMSRVMVQRVKKHQEQEGQNLKARKDAAAKGEREDKKEPCAR